MRLDKFLKISRLIKRRTVAKEVGDRGWIAVNGRQAKPGDRVKVGDRLEMTFGPRRLVVEIVEIRENAPANRATDLYRIISETVDQAAR